MGTNDTNTKKQVIYADLSYKLTGLSFRIHNTLGRFCKERVYCDALAQELAEANISFIRESKAEGSIGKYNVGPYRPDFIIDDKIVVEMKAKPFVTKDDYMQLLQYLRITDKRLGLLINFRNRFLKPKRIAN